MDGHLHRQWLVPLGTLCCTWRVFVRLGLYPEQESLVSWDRKGGIQFPIVSYRILCFKKSLGKAG